MAASAKDCWVATVCEHGGWRRKGVESPVADNGLSGRVRKQSSTVALSAVVAAVDVAVAEVVAEVGESASVVWLTNLA